MLGLLKAWASHPAVALPKVVSGELAIWTWSISAPSGGGNAPGPRWATVGSRPRRRLVRTLVIGAPSAYARGVYSEVHGIAAIGRCLQYTSSPRFFPVAG